MSSIGQGPQELRRRSLTVRRNLGRRLDNKQDPNFERMRRIALMQHFGTPDPPTFFFMAAFVQPGWRQKRPSCWRPPPDIGRRGGAEHRLRAGRRTSRRPSPRVATRLVLRRGSP